MEGILSEIATSIRCIIDAVVRGYRRRGQKPTSLLPDKGQDPLASSEVSALPASPDLPRVEKWEN